MRGIAKRLVAGYLALLARIRLARRPLLFVAVAGASGKTSTVAATAAALGTHYRVRTGTGMNSETGVPLGILGVRMESYGLLGWLRALLAATWNAFFLKDRCDAYVAEYGIDHPGDMRRLLRIRIPDIAVMTGVALEHAGFFAGSKDEVLAQLADEELALLEALPEKAVAVVNVDDERVRARIPRLRCKVASVGWSEEAAYELTRYGLDDAGTSLELYGRGVTYAARLPHALSRDSAMSLALGAVAAHQADVPLREGLRAIEQGFAVPPGRGVLLRGREGRAILDSSYNATPGAVSDALGMLAGIAGIRRRVAILGDMRELGDLTGWAHRELAPRVAACSDLAVLVGPAMNEHLRPELEAHRVSCVGFADAAALLKGLDEILEPGDAVLVKGSQNTLFLERVTEALLADPADAARLPRRGARWDAARAAAS